MPDNELETKNNVNSTTDHAVNANLEEDFGYARVELENSPEAQPALTTTDTPHFFDSLADYHNMAIEIAIQNTNLSENASKVTDPEGKEFSTLSHAELMSDPRSKIKTVEYSSVPDVQFLVQDYISFFPAAEEIFGKGEFINHEEKPFAFKPISAGEINTDIALNNIISLHLSPSTDAFPSVVFQSTPPVTTPQSSGFLAGSDVVTQTKTLSARSAEADISNPGNASSQAVFTEDHSEASEEPVVPIASAIENDILFQSSHSESSHSGNESQVIVPLNEAPVLMNTAVALASINEDAGAPVGAVGTLVSSLMDLSGGGGQNNVTDIDSNNVGIAITASDTTNGSWWYSINNGANWSSLGSVSESAAKLLAADANTRIYFQPNANFNGTVNNGITFRAWDQSTGTNGSVANITTTGGNSAFSTSTDTASIVVNAINDAPVLDASKTPSFTSLAEDSAAPSGAVGNLVSSLVDFTTPTGGLDNVTDNDTGALLGIAITASDTSHGTWYYSLNGGSNWSAVGAVSESSARVLAADANTRLYFQPNPNYYGSSTITFRAWDRTTDSNGSLANASISGGSTAFSLTTDTAAILITAVPDALFTAGNDSVDFNNLLPSDYILSYDALGGNDIIILPNTAAKIAEWGYNTSISFTGGLGDDTITGSNVGLSISGGTGTDTISYANVTDAGVNVSLVTNTTTGLSGSSKTGSDHLANFENVTGSNFADILVGDGSANTLIGGGGNDSLEGRGGADTYAFNIVNSLGTDTLNDSGGTDVIDLSQTTDTSKAANVNLSLSSLQTVSSNLSLIISVVNSIENVIGGAGNDVLTGSSVVNVLIGGSGNDTLEGLAGGDTLEGGLGDDTYKFNTDTNLNTDKIIETDTTLGGIDTLDFSNSSGVIEIDLNAATENTGNIAFATFSGAAPNIENIYGGSGINILTGNALSNVLQGNSSNDTFTGLAGDDTLIGGSGDDTYIFNIDTNLGMDTINEFNTTLGGSDTFNFSASGMASSVKINLDTATETTTNIDFANLASFAPNIENIFGGAGADELTGNALANILRGNESSDTLTGLGGNDTLEGGSGNDVLAGGEDNDTYLFNLNSDLGTDTITELTTTLGGVDTFDFSADSTAIRLDLTAGTENTTNLAFQNFDFKDYIENIIGGGGADTIIGNASANFLQGNAGADTLIGNAGADTLEGGAANDRLEGGLGDDTYVYNLTGSSLGNDTIIETSTTLNGIDTLDFSGSSIVINVNLGTSTESTADISFTSFSSAAPNIENLFGGSNADVLTGNALDNYIKGNAGVDILKGNAGADILQGGAGADTLTGDAGSDQFKYTAVGELGDVITDFTHGVDSFKFDSTAFQGNSGGTLLASAFAEGTGPSASTSGVYFIFNTSNGQLFYDADSSGGGVGVMVADTQLSGSGSLTNTDIQFF